MKIVEFKKPFNIFLKSKMNSFSNSEGKLHNGISYISSEQAKLIDEELMGQEIGYATEQLMEIAGLSIAKAVNDAIEKEQDWKKVKRILNISGPGNNGGDGLIASRYLKEFGFDVDILYPKRTDKELYLRLIKQSIHYEITFVDESVIDKLDEYDLILDSIFGFSFKGDIRCPFDKIIKSLNKTNVKIASVDVPSGWDVDQGNTLDTFTPSMLISLTLPKLSVTDYKGIHYVAGRFVPSSLYNKLSLVSPKYKGSEMYRLI